MLRIYWYIDQTTCFFSGISSMQALEVSFSVSVSKFWFLHTCGSVPELLAKVLLNYLLYLRP